MRCCIQQCKRDTKTSKKYGGITFHLFPKDPIVRSAWVKSLKMGDWRPHDRSTICSDHFRKEDMYNTLGGLTRIKTGALPAIKIKDNDLESSSSSDTLLVCRICLCLDDKMYDMETYDLNTLYHKITGPQNKIEDNIPLQLCWECVHRLNSFNQFIRKAKTSHNILLRLSRRNENITLEDLLSVNREKRNLKSSLGSVLMKPEHFDLIVNEDESGLVSNANCEVRSTEKIEAKNESNTSNALNKTEYLAGLNLLKKENANEDFDRSSVFDENDEDSSEDVSVKEEIKVGYDPQISSDMESEGSMEVLYLSDFDSDDDELFPDAMPKDSELTQTLEDKDLDMDLIFDNIESMYDADQELKNERKVDEDIFMVTPLSFDEQLSEVKRREQSSGYRHSPYKCTICYKGYTEVEKYEQHIVKHSAVSGNFECLFCKIRVKTEETLRQHMSMQHAHQYSCKMCTFTTRNIESARYHQKSHPKESYKCRVCSDVFDTLVSYIEHTRLGHGPDSPCELCGYIFIGKKGVELHKTMKHKLVMERPPPLRGPYCSVCRVKFLSEAAYDKHLSFLPKHNNDHHLNNDARKMDTDLRKQIDRRLLNTSKGSNKDVKVTADVGVECEECGVELKNLFGYANHVSKMHTSKNRSKHHSKYPFMCEFCGKGFQSKSTVKAHSWVHTGKKLFKCDHCPKSFTMKGNLQIHMKVHTASKPSFKCPICGKGFSYFSNMRRHRRVHVDLKPYKCETCEKCFRTTTEYRAHVNHVHLKKPWPKRTRPRRQKQ